MEGTSAEKPLLLIASPLSSHPACIYCSVSSTVDRHFLKACLVLPELNTRMKKHTHTMGKNLLRKTLLFTLLFTLSSRWEEKLNGPPVLQIHIGFSSLRQVDSITPEIIFSRLCGFIPHYLFIYLGLHDLVENDERLSA